MENNKAEQILTAPGAQKKIKKVVMESQKKVAEDKAGSVSENFKSALLSFLPAIAGGLFEGSAGAARGADISLNNLQKEADRQIQRDQQSQQNAQFKQNLEAEGILADQRMAEEKRQFDTMTGFKAMEVAGGSPAQKEFQARASGFAKEAAFADAEYNKIIAAGYNPGSLKHVGNTIVEGVLPDSLESVFKSDARAAAQAYEDTFADAILRDRSGAALPDAEIARKKKALHRQIGESDAVAAAKAKLREHLVRVVAEKGGLGPEDLSMIDASSGSGKNNADRLNQLLAAKQRFTTGK